MHGTVCSSSRLDPVACFVFHGWSISCGALDFIKPSTSKLAIKSREQCSIAQHP